MNTKWLAYVHWCLDSMLGEQLLVGVLHCCSTFRDSTLLFPVHLIIV